MVMAMMMVTMVVVTMVMLRVIGFAGRRRRRRVGCGAERRVRRITRRYFALLLVDRVQVEYVLFD